MAASINDKFSKVISGVTRPVATTLSAQKISGATTASVVATTGWDTATAVHGIMYKTDSSNVKIAGSQIDWKGTISGTTISDFTITAGNDDTYEVGDAVELSPTAAWADDLVSGLVVEHNQDGTHSDVTADSVTTGTLVITSGTTFPTGDIATADIASGAITNAKLSTTTGEVGGAWTTYTPALTNITIGNGTLACYYTRIGKGVKAYGKLTFGSTTSVSGSAIIALPVTASSNVAVNNPVGTMNALDASSTIQYPGIIALNSTTTGVCVWGNAGGSYVQYAYSSSTVPFTWTTSDAIYWSLDYEGT